MDLTLRVEAQRGPVVIRLFKDAKSPTSYKEFAFTVSWQGGYWRVDIPAMELQELLQAVRSASIPIVSGGVPYLDGVSCKLTVKEISAEAIYRWGSGTSGGWEPLDEIASKLLHLAFQVSGHYMP